MGVDQIDTGFDALEWAESGALFIYTRFNTNDGFATNTSGSGSVTLALARYTMETGTTSGSVAEMRDRSLAYAGDRELIQIDDTWSAQVAAGFQSTSSASDSEALFATGRADAGSNNWIGVRKKDNNDLVLVGDVNGTETESVIETGYTRALDSFTIRRRKNAGVSVENRAGARGSLGESALPTGTMSNNMSAVVDNGSAAENVRLDLYDYRFAQPDK